MAVDEKTMEETNDQPVAETAGTPKPERKSFLMPVSVPNATIKEAIDTAAKAANLSTGRYVLNIVAEKLGITLPPISRTRVRKYATPELAEKARKDSMALRNNKIKTSMRMAACIAVLVSENRSGEIAEFTSTVLGLTNDNKFDEAMTYMKERFPNVD